MNIQPANNQMSLPTIALEKHMPADEWQKFMAGLRELDAACGTNKHDRATALICACIDAGINTGGHIIAVLRSLDFNPRHVGTLLHHNTGDNPKRFQWTRDPSGAYCNTDSRN